MMMTIHDFAGRAMFPGVLANSIFDHGGSDADFEFDRAAMSDMLETTRRNLLELHRMGAVMWRIL